jgi:hypothetical protein
MKTHRFAPGCRPVVFAQQRDSGRQIETLRQPQGGAEHEQVGRVSRQSGEQRDQAPNENTPEHDFAARIFVGEVTRERRCDGIGPQKKQAGQSNLRIGHAQIFTQGRNDGRKGGSVSVVQARRHKQKDGDSPWLGQRKESAIHKSRGGGAARSIRQTRKVCLGRENQWAGKINGRNGKFCRNKIASSFRNN